MIIKSLQDLREAPKADLYVVVNTQIGGSMATHHIADVEHAFRHSAHVTVHLYDRKQAVIPGGVPRVAKHLRFDMRGCYEAGNNKHPQQVMRDLGITYGNAVPQTIGDQWWFIDCNYASEMVLPAYISPMTLSPEEMDRWCGIADVTPIEPRRPSTWPLFEEDAPKLSYCVCVRCERLISDRFGGSHYCTVNPAPDAGKCEHELEIIEDAHRCTKCGKTWHAKG